MVTDGNKVSTVVVTSNMRIVFGSSHTGISRSSPSQNTNLHKS